MWKFIREHSNWIGAGIFALGLFFQCCLFELWICETSLIDTLFGFHPMRLLSTYTQKVAISLFFASFILVSKRKWWAVVVLFANSVWILAECFYRHFFDGMLIDSYTVKMAGNLDGFMSSLMVCLDWRYLWLLLPVVVLAIFVSVYRSQARNRKGMVILLVSSFILNIAHASFITHYMRTALFMDNSRFIVNLYPLHSHYNASDIAYSHLYSEVHALMRLGVELVINHEEEVDVEQLEQDMKPFVQQMDETPSPKTPLVFFLVESLENWAVTPEITPNIYALLQTEHTFHATRIKKQTKAGGSMDGQILVNTGLLPLKEGASCYRYPYNRYPSLSECYSRKAMIVPGGVNVYNQGCISKGYKIDTNYETSSNDAEICGKYEEIATEYDYVMVITASSHAPWQHYKGLSDFSMADGMPYYVGDYLRTINYMDKCFGHAVQYMDSIGILNSVTIVITGDHTALRPNIRGEVQAWCDARELPFKPCEGYCPLIIHGPTIQGKRVVDDEAYQMDVYPTVLAAIGCEDYFWKGFGVNLMDSVQRNNRPINEVEAYELSDKVIRANWLEKFETNAANE